MAFLFTDGFDCYAATADAILGYWDSGGTANLSLQTGRFTGSRAIRFGAGVYTNALVKSSGSNDATHHICCAFYALNAVSGTNECTTISLFDGSTAQCTIVFRSDGTILLKSGAVGGSTLATYSSAFTANLTWYHFEFEVVINNTTGSFKVRKNGNGSDDHSTTSINTRGGTANNYANKIQFGNNFGSGGAQQLDDFIWRSDSTLSWIGETRCRTRMPAADSGTPDWTRSASGAALTLLSTPNTNTGITAGVAKLSVPLTVVYAGTIASVSIGVTNPTGNIKVAVYADNGSGTAPTTVLGQSAGQASGAGTNVCNIVTPFNVLPGQIIWIAACSDTTGTQRFDTISGTGGNNITVAYASFPQANPVLTSGVPSLGCTVTYSAATGNYQMVQEAQTDGVSTYNYDTTSGHTDRFTLTAIDTTPATVFCTTVRALIQKSDAGSKNTKVLLKSSSTEVDTGSQAPNAGVWGWQYRTDTTDPATSAAWTATGVNNALIGVQVV